MLVALFFASVSINACFPYISDQSSQWGFHGKVVPPLALTVFVPLA